MFRCFITNDYVFLLQAYISYVRPILEYNSSIWNPHTIYIGNAKALERVQRLFTKRLFYRCNISMAPYSNRLIYFNIKSLSHRRLISDMVLTYKILNVLVDVEATSIFYTYSSQCRGPLINLRPSKCKSTYYLNYFGNRVPSLWNSLPNNMSSCKSVNCVRVMLKHSYWLNSYLDLSSIKIIKITIICVRLIEKFDLSNPTYPTYPINLTWN